MKKFFNGLIFIVICMFLNGCDNSMSKKYNLKLYYNIDSSFNDMFIEQHITNGAFYKNVLYNNVEVPKNYVITIESETDAINIFDDVPFEIDFDKQNIIIYAYTTNYATASCELMEVKFENNKCNIYVKENLGPIGTGSATMPTTRFIIVTLDKIVDYNYNFIIK